MQVIAAISENATALRYADDNLKRDRNFVLVSLAVRHVAR